MNGNSVDLLAAYNTANTSHLSNTVDWTPQFSLSVDASSRVTGLVSDNAGSGRSIAVLQDNK